MRLLFHFIGLVCVFAVTYALLGLTWAIIISLVFAVALDRQVAHT